MIKKSNSHNPLISFCLVAYKQEEYIREAINGALNQTYSPLEIILSDDCSPDRTFEIMQEMTSDYKGPHKIILNRNEKNIGLVAHINKVVKLSRGEWIVKADGDDISLENRVEVISKIIKSKNIFGITTASQLINRHGEIKGTEYYRETIFGSNSNWHRKCFTHFGELPEILSWEDNVLFFRSMLLGGVAFSDTITVKYRMFDSISNKNYASLKDYYTHKSKINKGILDTLNVRINELNNIELDSTIKLKAKAVLQQKFNNISQKKHFMDTFLDFKKKSINQRFNILFVQKDYNYYPLKSKMKLLFLPNAFFAKTYTFIAPGWLKITFNNSKINLSNNITIKTLDDYTKETDSNTPW